MTALSAAVPGRPLSGERECNALQLSIGPVDVAITSCREELLEDVRQLYVHRPLSGDRPVIQVDVRREALRPWRYRVYGDGGSMFRGVRREELLPFIEWAINWRFIERCRTHLQLHAATLSHRGRGVIFSAASGSGKSTLAASLLARGWRYLCDEFALIDLRTRMLEPFPKALCVKSGSFDVVERLGLPLRRGRHHVKAFKGEVAYLSMTDLGPEAIGEPCSIEAIVFPQYVPGAATRLTEIPRAQAVIDLARQAFNRQWLGARAMTLLSDVVRDAVCVRMVSGDADGAARALEQLVEAAPADSGS